jgi:hypothetical protein
MAKLSYKVSYYVLYALFAIIAVVLVLFYCVGYNNPVGDLNSPQYTDALIYLKYALVVVTIALAVFASLAQFIASTKDNPKGAVKSLIALALLAVVIIVSYSLASTDTIMVNGEPYTDTAMLKIADMSIFSMYILGAVAAIATLVNMSGIFKK